MGEDGEAAGGSDDLGEVFAGDGGDYVGEFLVVSGGGWAFVGAG